ncbi:hypothetical protein KAX02_05415 [candidate division WOR-3 bacterium]|nr:hypothetical protein [candidate division WOR-3 bacterium]
MPRPNEHSCDINPDFKILGQMSRVHDGKKYQILIGKGADGKSDEAIYHYPKDIWDAESAENHCKSHKGTFHAATKEFSQEPEFYELKDIDVVVKGKWKGNTFTDQMLDNIVSAFNELKGKVNVKFKLGHDDKQKLVQADGYPNIGIINSLKKVGDRIKAHIIKIPKKVMDLMNAKAYNEVSPEINPSYYDSTTKKTYKNILWNVALLGEQHKAMNSLTDIHNLYFADKKFEPEYSGIVLNFAEPLIMEEEMFNCECIKCGYKMKSEKHCNTLKCPECGGDMRREERPGPGQPHEEEAKLKAEEVKKMELEEKLKESKEQLEKFEEQNKQLTKDLDDSNAKLKTVEKEKKEIQTGLDKFAQTEADNKINEFIEKGIKDGKILPAQKDNIFALISAKGSETVKFTVEKDGKPVEKEGTMIELYESILNSIPFNLVKMSEETVQETEDKTSSDEKKKMEEATGMGVVDDDIDKKAKKYAEEHDVPYEEALDKIT